MTDKDQVIAVKVQITGKVQGVGYRAWCQHEAQSLGLYGWVRNRTGGSVEALFKGHEATVKQMVKACYAGPAAAVVEAVEETPARGITPNRFDFKPTV